MNLKNHLYILDTRIFTDVAEFDKFIIDHDIETRVQAEIEITNRYLKAKREKEKKIQEESIEVLKSVVELSNEQSFLLEELEERYKTKYKGRYANSVRKSRNGIYQLDFIFSTRR